MADKIIASGASSLPEKWIELPDGTYARQMAAVSANSDGTTQDGLPPGRAAAADSVPVALSTEDLAALLPARTTTNRSLSTSTTAANAMAANTARRGWKVKNDSAIDVFINFTGTATTANGVGNFKIAAGGYLASEPGYVETGAMSIIAASGTPAITILEFS